MCNDEHPHGRGMVLGPYRYHLCSPKGLGYQWDPLFTWEDNETQKKQQLVQVVQLLSSRAWAGPRALLLGEGSNRLLGFWGDDPEKEGPRGDGVLPYHR